jgi:hypothetical protein
MNVIKEEEDTDEVGSPNEDAVGVKINGLTLPPTLTIRKSETMVSYVCVFPLCSCVCMGVTVLYVCNLPECPNLEHANFLFQVTICINMSSPLMT